jgi:hypothetical protein
MADKTFLFPRCQSWAYFTTWSNKIGVLRLPNKIGVLRLPNNRVPSDVNERCKASSIHRLSFASILH